MANRKKIGFTVFGLLALVVGLTIFVGLYAMSIEDHYGNYQEIFFQSKQGDIVVNRSSRKVKKVEKTWTRIYFIDSSDTIDLWSWLNNDTVEIFRTKTNSLSLEKIRYEDIDLLVADQKLELIIKNR